MSSLHIEAALDDGRRTWRADEIGAEVEALTARLRAQGTRVLATLMDNAPAWVVADLAALRAGAVHVPLPLFFTAEQITHVLQAAGVDTLLTLPPLAARWPQVPSQPLDVAGLALASLRLPLRAPAMPEGTVKITFTSGTTGAPKGVCLGAEGMGRVADGLIEALAPLDIRRHLCALPFAVLLENIAGLMAPLARGATCVTLPLQELGLAGSSSFDAARFQAAVARHRPHSIILLPQMLRAWTGHLAQSGQRAPDSLRMVAVGGAAVGAKLLAAARAAGIPAHEGYGLSEGASVQTLNLPGAERAGTAGRALPHARLRVAHDGEIEVAGSLFLGYLGQPAPVPEWWPTGDFGSIDADGFLRVEGRKKLVLITAFGRNVSPEWVETALRDEAAIGQAVVLGDGEPALSAVLWPLRPDAPDAALQAAVEAVNAALPDYARVRRWSRALAPFTPEAGMATPNGRPQRPAILRAHAEALGIAAPEPLPPEPPMSFHERLLKETQAARMGLLSAPIIQGCLRGEVSLPSYLAFLREAYHHVRHTVPLLRACKAALPARNAWLAGPLDEYIEEEKGHDEWILDDIRACGGDADAVRDGPPGHATEVMVAYAYDTIARRNPLGFFGMVHVLEGTSVSLALLAADQIQKPLGLPDSAFSYLRSHGTLDQEHTAHFAMLMDQVEDPRDQADIVHAARAFFRLYGDVFRGLPLPKTEAATAAAGAAA
jgi:long-subunit acyl-CoA synthetase (AMP-forming)/pyrroloquinoline quinone (PQQ) biosynthesis protein C